MQQNDINAMTMIACLGGKNNIISVTNCMTRLRVTVKDPSKVDEEKLRSQSDVMGLFHERENYYEIVVGPGKSRKYADSFHETDLPAAPGRLRAGLKTIGEIFVPLIPGIITAGPRGAVSSVLIYLAGLLVSYVCSFLITVFAYDKSELLPESRQ